MSKRDGVPVLHFGQWYLWGRTESGALALYRLDRMVEAVREVKEALIASAVPSDAGTD